MAVENKYFKLFYRNKYFGLTIVILSIIIIISMNKLLNFIELIPESIKNANHTSDAIVVLTGGSNRLKRGLELLTEKKAKKLFISGVYRGNDVRRLLQVQKHKPTEVVCCIHLGYTATSTAGNALESAIWIRKNNFNSIILVTANYHMPRSLLLFRQIMPKIIVIPHPVFPAKFEPSKWWARPRTVWLITSEFIKYTISSTEWWFKGIWANPNKSNDTS